MQNEPKSNKEQYAYHRIIQLIHEDAYPVGSRLPSERRLAEKLGTSRNTLRGAMRQLQAHGVVEIRSGSGNYVIRKEIPLPLVSQMSDAQHRASLGEVMEVRFLVEPVIGMHAAEMATPADIEGLEACLMRMSRASIDNLHEQMIREDRHFRKLLAQGGKNRLMVLLHECIASQENATILGRQLPENDKASLFAGYVGIFNAVQHRQIEQTYKGIQNHILGQCRLMMERESVEMPATIVDALRHMKRNPNDDEEKQDAEAAAGSRL